MVRPERDRVQSSVFFFNDTATTEIYTLSLHDALPISLMPGLAGYLEATRRGSSPRLLVRSEEHTSELQSQSNLVCRLLLEKQNTKEPDNPQSTTRGVHACRAASTHSR